jgi:hypothetical protein
MRVGTITIDEKVRAKTNTLILGSPGFGKSKFMEAMMRQDLRNRQPFCLIDLHGKLYHLVKQWCAFNTYYDRRLLLVDPSQGEYITACNFFRPRDGFDVSVQVAGMVEAVLSAWGDRNMNTYPVIFKLLTIVFTVMVQKGLTLIQGFQLLADRDKLSDAIASLKDPVISALWKDLLKLAPSEWSRQVAPTVTRLFRLIRSNAIKKFMCQLVNNLELTFEDTILVNLGTSGILDDDAKKVFAALLLNDFYQSALRRKGKNGREPSPYYVYVDEWWLVPSPDFGRILFETRKFGLLLVLANQDLSQIKENFGAPFAESILTLCQAQLCFGGLNHTDASRLAREFGIDVPTLRTLAERECLVRLPRENAAVAAVPEVRDPFILESGVAAFERKLAEKNGASAAATTDTHFGPAKNEAAQDEELQFEDLIRQ